MAKSLQWFLLGLLVALLGIEHLYALQSYPGFHYDESWAANFAFSIVNHQIPWPIHAMSPYTFAWAHYIAALFFYFFGVNLLVFRISQLSMALLGIAALARMYWKKEPKLGLSFLFLVAMLPALCFNHRFAIELNGFHVLCFGLFFLCYDRRMIWTALLIAWFGVTSHILFFAPILAFLGSRLLQSELKERERNGWILWCAALIPYFVHVAHTVPETKKAYALLLFTVVLLFFLLFRGERTLKKLGSWPQHILPFVALPFLVNALFFLPGEWSVLFNTGQGIELFPILTSAIVSAWLGYFLWMERANWTGVLLCATIAGVMMLKPTPRYYECTMLGIAVLTTKSFFTSSKFVKSMAAACLLLNALIIYHGYFSAAHQQRSIHFLVWKDDSREFLPKQELAKFLGLNGCSLSAITNVDSRTYEPLRFLSHGDWAMSAATCTWSKALLIMPSSEAPKVARAKQVGGFQVLGAP